MNYGDAPDSYLTLAANGGPSHIIKPGIQLGVNVDAELDGQPSETATGDQTDPDGEDEDGVVMALSEQPSPSGLVWTLHGFATASAPGWLLIQADINQNGRFDPEETLTRNLAGGQAEPMLVFAGPNEFSFPLGGLRFVPNADPDYTIGINSVVVRFRFSTAKESLLIPVSPDGEVEDHQVELQDSLNITRVEIRRTEDGRVAITWGIPEAVLQRSSDAQGPFTDDFEARSPQVQSVEDDSLGLWRIFSPPR